MNRARDALRKESSQLGSTILAEIAVHLNQDTFTQVKELIQGLIVRLAGEANSEETHKSWCDKELLTAANDRDNRMAEVNKINAKITSLNAKEDELNLEMEELKKYTSWLGLELSEARKLRLEEKAANMETINTSKEAIDALKGALVTLRSLYHQTELKAHTASYTGEQTKASKILGLMEGMLQNFEAKHTAVLDMEAKHERVFVNYYGVSSSEIKGSSTKEEMDEDSLAGVKIRQDEAHSELQKNMDLLDGALKELKARVPQCLDSSMSFSARKAAREQEVNALKTVFCTLAKGEDAYDTENC